MSSELRGPPDRFWDTAYVPKALVAAATGTWRWDRESGELLADRVLEETICGLEPGSLKRIEDIAEVVHPDDRDLLRAVMQAPGSSDSPAEAECRVRRASGAWGWVLVRAARDARETVGAFVDITHRRRTEQQARDWAAQAEAASERLAFMTGVNDALVASMDHDEALLAVADAAVPRLGDWCVIWVLGADGYRIRHRIVAHADDNRVREAEDIGRKFDSDMQDGRGMAAIMNLAEPRLVADLTDGVTEISDEVLRTYIRQLGIRSAVATPLRAGGRHMGAILFALAETPRHFDTEDLALAAAVAGRVAGALENLDLYEQQRSIAAALQSHLLPRSLPKIKGLEVAVRYWTAGTATTVGGDLYDLFGIGDDRWAFVVGDVCGTGPEAAAMTAATRHTLRAVAKRQRGHRDVLGAVNDALRAEETDRFVTVLYGVAERAGQDWSLEIASGGHPLPVLIGEDGSFQIVGRPGTLLGALDEVSIRTERIPLRVGEKLLAYTDGITDVAPPHGMTPDELAARAAEAIAPCETAEQAAEEMGRLISRVRPVADRDDDIALMILHAVG